MATEEVAVRQGRIVAEYSSWLELHRVKFVTEPRHSQIPLTISPFLPKLALPIVPLLPTGPSPCQYGPQTLRLGPRVRIAFN